jgi:hypothetical protein
VQSDQTARARPDFLNAVHGFVIVKTNQNPYNKKPIDYNMVQRYIEDEIKRLGGLEVEQKFLEQMVSDAPNSIMSFLLEQAGVTSKDQLREARQDYGDLVRVTEIIFGDRITDIRKSLGKRPRVGFDPNA